MRRSRAVRYVRVVNWFERRLDRLRSFDPLVVDGVLAGVFTIVGVATAFGQDISDDEGFREPSAPPRRVRARDSAHRSRSAAAGR